MKPATQWIPDVEWHLLEQHPSPPAPARCCHAHTPFGWMKIDLTERHLVGVSFVTPPETIHPDPTSECLASLILKGEPLPIQPWVQGTRFQIAVWRVLADIPRGSVMSYRDVARKLGCPGASRAVGQAVGRNPLAVVIPCHRILRMDGSLGGYHWGSSIKRSLLAEEGIIC